MQYAVRGKIALRAAQLAEQLKDPKRASSLSFTRIVDCSIGNPQALLQCPLTFPREVLSLFDSPFAGRPASELTPLYSEAAVERVGELVESIGGWQKTGAYTESRGLACVRATVAKYIQERDTRSSGVSIGPIPPDDVYLTNGASSGIHQCLALVKGGVMIPVPRYPLYSAALTLQETPAVGYYLDEDNGWSLSEKELERRYAEARDGGITPKALVVINPGNPTGQVLSVADIEMLLQFCRAHKMLLLADEVYQENTYTAPFHSFHSVAAAKSIDVSLISFHSTSKGMFGECGRRGGYMHLYRIDPPVAEQLLKVCSVFLCANVSGQIAVDCMVRPPPEGTAAGRKHRDEYDGLYESLRSRAALVTERLNRIRGVSCNPVAGAMYAFPRLTLPEALVAEAAQRNQPADELWALKLLEATGVVVVPGSGFGQREGTHHCRLTILPPEPQLEDVISKIKAFHEGL